MQALALVILAVALGFVLPQGAAAGLYTVGACDAAPPTYSVAGWSIQAGSVNSYANCPSAGGAPPNTRGMSTRMTDRTFHGPEFSRWWFYAPAGTTITRLDWAGRIARNHPSWAVEISAQGGVAYSRLVGYPAQPGASNYYTGFEPATRQTYWPPAGTTSLTQNTQCGAGSCPSGATIHTYYAAVTLNDFSPPAVSIGGVGEGEWVRASRTVTFQGVDNLGIKAAHLYIDGVHQGAYNYSCDYARPIPCANQSSSFDLATTNLTPGPHRIEVAVVDGSDTWASTARTIQVDNTPPAQVTPTVDGGERWRARNGFTVTWPSLADGGAPIVGGTWQLCRVGGSCTTHTIDPANLTALTGLQLSADGAHQLRIALRDAAGNVASLTDARPAALRLDRAAPQLAIDHHDPNTPVRAAATVLDPLSGLAGGHLEIRRVGSQTWHELDTTVDPQGSQLVAQIDDERFADGSYELRARAVDHAGNHAFTGTEANGARATRQLPVRIKTRLTAGRPTVAVVKRTVGRGKRKRVVRRRVTRIRPSVTVARGRHVRLQGRLVNPDGQPLHDVAVRVLTRLDIPGAGFAATGIVRTDRTGQFTYRTRGSTSRTLQFRFDGSTRIRPSTTNVEVAVPASSSFSLTPPRIVNGETVTFRGHIRGGPIPANGKLIELQKWTGRQWAPFRVVRTDPSGRWQHVEPVVSVSGVVIFKLRARIPAEAGFPFAAGRTPARKLRVRGL